MKIGIDARALASEKPSGIGIYLINILLGLKEKLDDYNLKKSDVVLYSDEQLLYYPEITRYYTVRFIPGKIGAIWCAFGLKKHIIKDEIDVFWGPNYIIPLNVQRNNIKTIQCVHDIALMINPAWGQRKNAILHNTFIKLACKKSDKIITISNSSKMDIVNYLHIPEKKINMIYIGGNGIKKKISNGSEIINRLFVNKGIRVNDYFLYIGTIEPRKNIDNIVRAFELLCEKTKNDNISLILAGGKGWRNQSTFELIEKSAHKDKIHYLGYISNEEKTALYQNAIASLLPSYYEGFGIPVVEAMENGCLVITTSVSSLPEAGGEAAYYISNPDDYESLSNIMIKVYRYDDNQRNESISKGYEQCLKFDWDKCVYDTLNILIKD